MRFRDARNLGIPTEASKTYRARLLHQARQRHYELMRSGAYRDDGEDLSRERRRVLVARVERKMMTHKPPRLPIAVAVEGPPCHWCGVATDLARNDSPQMATQDHIVPLFRVRTEGVIAGPTVTACKHCNTHRGHEQDGAWVPHPHWMSTPRGKIPPSQRLALFRRGLLSFA